MKRLIVAACAGALLLGMLGAPAGVGATSDSKGYVIGSNKPLTSSQVQALKSAGASLKYVYKNFGGAAGTIPASKVAAVRALPFVTGVRVDGLRQLDALVEATPAEAAAATATAPLPSEPYWLDLMNADKDTTYDGSGVWVADLDAGMFPNWRDFFRPESILTQYARAFEGSGVIAHQNWESGSDPHGMATAGTIVGQWFRDGVKEGGWGTGYVTGSPGTYWQPGVAEGAKIIPLQVCIPIGCFQSSINAAMDYVTSLKLAHPSQPIVINESLGGAGFEPTEKASIDAAIKAGVVVVASAGNEGNAGMGFPAAYEPVISAGAGGWVDQWTSLPSKSWYLGNPAESIDSVYVVDFSSRQLDGQYLDVVAPGRFLLLSYPCVNLYKDGEVVTRTNHKSCESKADASNPSAAPFQYLFISGTSFSSPATAGVVARMLQKNPGLSNADAATGTLGDPSSWGPGELETILEDSATPIPPGQVTVTSRTGQPDPECWEMPTCPLEATGAG